MKVYDDIRCIWQCYSKKHTMQLRSYYLLSASAAHGDDQTMKYNTTVVDVSLAETCFYSAK